LTPQEAIDMIEIFPFPFPPSEDEVGWNASYNRYFGRWEVTMVRRARGLYTSRDRRLTSLWYVTEKTGEIEGPFMQPRSTGHLVPWQYPPLPSGADAGGLGKNGLEGD
jgi:hypothetical protein